MNLISLHIIQTVLINDMRNDEELIKVRDTNYTEQSIAEASDPDSDIESELYMSNMVSTHNITYKDGFATTYRYLAINLDQLSENLKGQNYDEYLRLLIKNILTLGPPKNNIFTCTSHPSFFNIMVYEGQPCTFESAFEEAIKPSKEGFSKPSIEALKKERDKFISSGFYNIKLNIDWEVDSNVNDIITQVIEASK
jgi:hypothetical protein